MRRGIKKPTFYAAPEFERMCREVSKAALIDALWCACQLGTTEEAHEITTQAARNLSIALEGRGDRVPISIKVHASQPIDSDAGEVPECYALLEPHRGGKE